MLAISQAACGSSSNSLLEHDGFDCDADAASSSDTVSTKSVGGVGTVLVDSKGDVLYADNQDTASKMACTA